MSSSTLARVESGPSIHRVAASTSDLERVDHHPSRSTSSSKNGHPLAQDSASIQSNTTQEALSYVYPPSSIQFEREMEPLPPVDRGKSAYLFLLSAFVVETVVWGVPSSYGVFLNYYQVQGVGDGDLSGAGLLPLVGSFAGGLMYLMGPPIAFLLNPRPKWRIPAIRIGSIVCVLGLLSSSFAKTPWQLLLTQGLLYSLGGSFVYYPTFSFLSEWFVERRGFANGVCFAGTAAGGLIYPFILNWLLSNYGAGVTLQALAGITFLLLAAAMPLLRPRVPVGKTRHSSKPGTSRVERRKLFRSKRLWVFMLANIAQAFGFFLPSLYLPAFAAAIGLSGAEGSALLACVNGTSVISRVALGFLSDRISPHKLGAYTMAASSLSVLLLWGVASTSLTPLLAFSLVLGLVCGGWTSLYASIVKDAAEDDPQLATTLFGLVSFTRGVGSLLTAPISSLLISNPLRTSNLTGFGVAQGKYGSVVIFAGVALAIAAAMEVMVFA